MLHLHHNRKGQDVLTGASHTWLSVGSLWEALKHTATWSGPRDSDCAGLEYRLGIGSLRCCPGESLMQPRSRTTGLDRLASIVDNHTP